MLLVHLLWLSCGMYYCWWEVCHQSNSYNFGDKPFFSLVIFNIVSVFTSFCYFSMIYLTFHWIQFEDTFSILKNSKKSLTIPSLNSLSLHFLYYPLLEWNFIKYIFWPFIQWYMYLYTLLKPFTSSFSVLVSVL